MAECKNEEVYLKDYLTAPEAVRELTAYFLFYNKELLHQYLAYNTPEIVYRGIPRNVHVASTHWNIPVWVDDVRSQRKEA